MAIASAETIVRHLAIFHRFFAAWDEAATAGDVERLWLCQWLADTLHNVPHMLTGGDDNPFWSRERIEAWISSFPSSLNGTPGVPSRLIDECREILSFTEPWETLALEEGLGDLDLAPAEEFNWAMRVFGWATLSMRQRAPWHRMDPDAWKWSRSCGAHMQPAASVLMTLPAGLIHWRDFDLRGFQQRLTEVWPQAPALPELG